MEEKKNITQVVGGFLPPTAVFNPHKRSGEKMSNSIYATSALVTYSNCYSVKKKRQHCQLLHKHQIQCSG